MKFQCKDEINQLDFDDSEILNVTCENNQLEFTLQGATVKAGNTQNGRYQDMYCGEIVLQLKNAKIARLVKEGMKYYDADGNLLNQVPDEDVPAPAHSSVLKRIAKGKIFTTVEDQVPDGYAYEFCVDVPQLEDEEEVDTFWLCVTFDESLACWDHYCSPVEE